MPKWYVNRKPATLLLVTVIGLLIGSLLSGAMSGMYDNVVKTIFTFPVTIGIGYPEPWALDLAFIKFKIGFQLHLTLLSFVGVVVGLWIYRWYE